jgi:hypothetical protein
MFDREHRAVSEEDHGGIVNRYITDNGVKVG